jgi:hypothetical protein
MVKKYLVLNVVLVVLSVFCSSAFGAVNEVTFYSNINYGGTAVTLGVGSYTMDQLTAAGIKNDDISSIKIPAGYVVTIYENRDFTGTSLNFESNVSNLVNYNFNDTLSAVTIANGVTFYRNINYGGAAVTLGVGSYTMDQITAAGIKNDDISSIKVPAGYTVTIYENRNLTGASLHVGADVRSLLDYDFNDKLSAVKIDNGATFYTSINYSNTAVTLGVGSYTLAQLKAVGIKNDDISSIKVPAGYSVTIYENSDFTGNALNFKSDVSSLLDYGFNDKLSAVMIVFGPTFYRNINYGGAAVTLGVGSYTMDQMIAAGIKNDDISSIKVPAGYTVTVYENRNFTGTALTFTSDISNLLDYNFNDTLSAVIISKN